MNSSTAPARICSYKNYQQYNYVKNNEVHFSHHKSCPSSFFTLVVALSTRNIEYEIQAAYFYLHNSVYLL